MLQDEEPLFTAEFLETLAASGVQSVKLPPLSPYLNAHAERFVRTIKESCLERLILLGEGSLRKALHEFVVHYHYERNHQGRGNRLIIEAESGSEKGGPIQCHHRLNEHFDLIKVAAICVAFLAGLTLSMEGQPVQAVPTPPEA